MAAKKIVWNEEKNQLLQIQRCLSFEEVVQELKEGRLLDRLLHTNTQKYPNQKIYVVRLKGYICYVPYVETDTMIFLKTIIPSRKLAKIYAEQKREQ